MDNRVKKNCRALLALKKIQIVRFGFKVLVKPASPYNQFDNTLQQS